MAILARDGTPIAQGEARLSELDPLASEIAGRVGPAPPEREEELAARGVPDGAPVGLTGLEREFDSELAGTAGGELLAGRRILASAEPEPGRDVRTTIDPDVQRAAVQALAGRYGGIAAVRPRTGEVLALAGVAFSAPQPPGSVFKIITLAGALEAGTVRRNESFPVETAATLEGVELENAHGESCGGSLINSFAHSCNSVFAPMGAELGAEQLVAAAERFGFNEDPGLIGAARSTIPAAGRDRRRPGRGLDGDRPGQGAHHAAPDGAHRRRDRRGRAPHAAHAAPRRGDRVLRGHPGEHGPLRRPRDARGGDRRHRRRRPGPRRGRGGQDRHGRAALHGQRGPGAGRAGRAAAGGGPHGHRRVVRRLRARCATRASPSPCS